MKSSSSSRAPCKTVSLTCTVGQLWSYTSRTLTLSAAHFLCVCTFFDGPQRAAQDRSCSASQAATTAFMVATRAAVDRCGPGNVVVPLLTRTEEGWDRGGGERVALHGQGPEDSSSPASALQPVRRRALRRAACQPGRAAEAAGAGTATHHGAACRRRSFGALSCCT